MNGDRPGALRLVSLEGQRRNGNGIVSSILATPTDDDLEILVAGLDTGDLAQLSLDELYEGARHHRAQAEYHYGKARHHWIEVGRYADEIKRRLTHGEFMATAMHEIGLPYEQIRKAMYVAQNPTASSALSPETGLNKLVEAVHEQKRALKAAMPRPVPLPVELPSQINIEVADCLDLPLPDGHVDLIVTSPPYGLGVEYADTDDDEGYTVYMQHVFAWAVELFRVAAPQGRICLNVPLDVTYGGTKPIYADWLRALTDAGWRYKTTIIWNEDNVSKSVARGSVDSPSAPHVFARVETILVMHKGDWNLKRADSHNLSHEDWLAWTNGMWAFPGEYRSDHPAPFPEELPKRCVTLFSFTGDVVLDPFLGSGTTAVAAAKLGRRIYGFDHSPAYIESARARVAEAIT